MLDIRAYGDESDSPRHFALTCAFAPFATWRAFANDWARLLDRESYLTDEDGLREFKAHDCAQGSGRFRGLDVGYRQALYREFAEIIQRHNLSAAAIVVDQAAWPTFAELLRPLGGIFDKPWPFAFGQLLPLVVRLCPADERIAFLFDDQTEFEHKAHEGFHAYKYAVRPIPYLADLRSQLGRITFDDSRLYPAVQAANLLGYEVRLRMRLERQPRRSWERTREQMLTVAIGYFSKSVAERWTVVEATARERGVHMTDLSPEQMQVIIQALPPLASEFAESPPLGHFFTNVSDLPKPERD